MSLELEVFKDEAPKRTAVRAFMLETLKEMVVERVLAGQSVAGFKEALELVNEAFDKLDQK